MTGKRLRANLMLAPLLGQARCAYDLWLAQGRQQDAHKEPTAPITLVALVRDGEGREVTLASLEAAGIEARLIPGSKAPDCDAVLPKGDHVWLLAIESGDQVSPQAGALYRAEAAHAPATVHLLYADDDLVDAAGRRHTPHFKPAFNSELLRHFDYLTGAALVRSRTLTSEAFDQPDWPARLVGSALKRTEEDGGEPIRIPRVLHSRPKRPAPARPAALPQTDFSNYPSVSVIIPTRNQRDLLRVCLDGLARTAYPRKIDLIVIDNGSDDRATLDYLDALDPAFARVVRDDSPFNFAALNNRAAKLAKGDLLCFLNNDIEIIDPDWLITMATQALRPEIGAVGAQLLYPDGRVQHAGVVIGIGGAAAHAHRFIDPAEEGYFHRHALPQYVSAVTAACLLVTRARFEAVGGFDADRFAVSFNDVDLCLRLRAKGWRILYEPRARLVHHETASRGFDRDPVGAARQAREVAALQDRWGTQLASQRDTDEATNPDPYHHPNLSRVSERFVLRL